MTPLIGIATVIFLGITLWLYDHGLANALEAVAIRLLRHAQWLRARHERQERIQAGKLLSLTARLVPEVEGVEVQR